MNAAEERLSGLAAALTSPCLNCRNEARVQGMVMCGPCLDAASHDAVSATIAADGTLAA